MRPRTALAPPAISRAAPGRECASQAPSRSSIVMRKSSSTPSLSCRETRQVPLRGAASSTAATVVYSVDMAGVYTVNKKGKPRDRVMATAERILRAEGIAAVTTRRVAAAPGLPPMTLDRHFPGKDALVHALVEVGFAHWETRLAAAVKARSPRRRLENALTAYRDFALEEPRLFELMFLVPRPGIPSAPASLQATPSPAFREVLASLRACMRAGELAPGEPEDVLLLV